jgi:YidC/Oxa1 family membrane protein insertase
MQKRLILAIVLSFIVLLAFQALFFKPNPAEKAGQAGVTEPAVKTAPLPAVAPPSAAETAKESQPAPEQPPAPAQTVTGQAVVASKEQSVSVETSLFKAVWSNAGAVLRSWKLNRYKDDKGNQLEMVFPGPVEGNRFPFSLATDDPEFAGRINTALFSVSTTSLRIADGRTGQVRFEYADGRGGRVEKVFTFTGGRYDFDVEVNVWADGRKVEPQILWGPGLGIPKTPEEMKKRFGSMIGVAVFASGKVYRLDERKFKPQENAFNFVDWCSFEDNYFAALFINSGPTGKAAFLQEVRENAQPRYFLEATVPRRAYIGPKEYYLLKTLGSNTKALINWGFFGSIAEILLIIIRWVHQYVPNWGFAIIVLTFIIKVIFFPLTYSSTKSMAKMQEIQPKLKALRNKYKNSKRDINQRRAMNEEMMKLYKEHGINPAGGCLPMLIQIPVFWGLFRMLAVAVEFRHSPFIFWIKDLSLKDPTYITPILMGITQYISQKITPTSADPSQARMMLIMPVVMTIFFMNFQSGLVLYWLTSNVLQIGQQYIMNRMMLNKKRESNEHRRKK